MSQSVTQEQTWYVYSPHNVFPQPLYTAGEHTFTLSAAVVSADVKSRALPALLGTELG